MSKITAQYEVERDYNTVWHRVIITHGVRGDEDSILCDGPDEALDLTQRINDHRDLQRANKMAFDVRDEAERKLDKAVMLLRAWQEVPDSRFLKDERDAFLAEIKEAEHGK